MAAALNISNPLDELARLKVKHTEELKELRSTLEAKHKKEFEALRLLWDKDREELRKVEEEIRGLRKESEELKEELDTLR